MNEDENDENENVLVLSENQDWADPGSDEHPDLRTELTRRAVRRFFEAKYGPRVCYRCKEPTNDIKKVIPGKAKI